MFSRVPEIVLVLLFSRICSKVDLQKRQCALTEGVGHDLIYAKHIDVGANQNRKDITD